MYNRNYYLSYYSRRNNYPYSSYSYVPTTTQHTVCFSGKFIHTTVTKNASSVDSWVRTVCSAHLGQPLIVGLDCEWRPNRYKGQCNKVATLQLSIDDKCLIIQFFYIPNIPQSLKSFLADTNITFVGVGVGDDIEKLMNNYGLQCAKWADLDEPCRNYMGIDRQSLGLKGYASKILGVYIEKPKYVTRSNWEARNLSNEQVEYGCIDAHVSYLLGCKVLLSSNLVLSGSDNNSNSNSNSIK